MTSVCLALITKKLGSCSIPILTRKSWTNWKSRTFLEPIRELRSQSKFLPWNWNDRWSQSITAMLSLPGAEDTATIYCRSKWEFDKLLEIECELAWEWDTLWSCNVEVESHTFTTWGPRTLVFMVEFHYLCLLMTLAVGEKRNHSKCA